MEEKLEVEGEELKKNRIPRTIDYDLGAAFLSKFSMTIPMTMPMPMIRMRGKWEITHDHPDSRLKSLNI